MNIFVLSLKPFLHFWQQLKQKYIVHTHRNHTFVVNTQFIHKTETKLQCTSQTNINQNKIQRKINQNNTKSQRSFGPRPSSVVYKIQLLHTYKLHKVFTTQDDTKQFGCVQYVINYSHMIYSLLWSSVDSAAGAPSGRDMSLFLLW